MANAKKTKSAATALLDNAPLHIAPEASNETRYNAPLHIAPEASNETRYNAHEASNAPLPPPSIESIKPYGIPHEEKPNVRLSVEKSMAHAAERVAALRDVLEIAKDFPRRVDAVGALEEAHERIQVALSLLMEAPPSYNPTPRVKAMPLLVAGSRACVRRQGLRELFGETVTVCTVSKKLIEIQSLEHPERKAWVPADALKTSV